MNNEMKSFGWVFYFKANEKQWFTVIPKSSFDQQVTQGTVGHWNPGVTDFKFGEFVMQILCTVL